MDKLSELVNHSILVALLYYDEQKILENKYMFFGEITSANEKDGIVITFGGDREFSLPPIPNIIHWSPRGKYACVNGLVIDDPEFICVAKVVVPDDPNDLLRWEPNFTPFINPFVEEIWEFTYRHDREYENQIMELLEPIFVGKKILIGVNYFEGDEDSPTHYSQYQVHGIIKFAKPGSGFEIELSNGEIFILPPYPFNIHGAPYKEYELKSTGEIVSPDFVTILTTGNKESE